MMICTSPTLVYVTLAQGQGLDPKPYPQGSVAWDGCTTGTPSESVISPTQGNILLLSSLGEQVFSQPPTPVGHLHSQAEG